MTAAHITTDTINEGDDTTMTTTTCSDTCTRDPRHDGPHQNNTLTPEALFDVTFEAGDVIYFEGSTQPFAKILEVCPGKPTFRGSDNLDRDGRFLKDVQRYLPDSALSPWKHGRQPIRRRRWTDGERLTALKMAAWGCSSQMIGEELDRTPHAVVCELQRLGFNMKVLRKARDLR